MLLVLRFFPHYAFLSSILFFTFWRMIIKQLLYPLFYNYVFPFLSFYKISPMPYRETFAVLIFNCSLLDGTMTSLKNRSFNFFLALPDFLYRLQLGPDPIHMGKNGSFHGHLLENIRALELVCHRHIEWDNNIHWLWSCYSQTLHSQAVWLGRYGVPTSSSCFF